MLFHSLEYLDWNDRRNSSVLAKGTCTCWLRRHEDLVAWIVGAAVGGCNVATGGVCCLWILYMTHIPETSLRCCRGCSRLGVSCSLVYKSKSHSACLCTLSSRPRFEGGHEHQVKGAHSMMDRTCDLCSVNCSCI